MLNLNQIKKTRADLAGYSKEELQEIVFLLLQKPVKAPKASKAPAITFDASQVRSGVFESAKFINKDRPQLGKFTTNYQFTSGAITLRVKADNVRIAYKKFCAIIDAMNSTKSIEQASKQLEKDIFN